MSDPFDPLDRDGPIAGFASCTCLGALIYLAVCLLLIWLGVLPGPPTSKEPENTPAGASDSR